MRLKKFKVIVLASAMITGLCANGNVYADTSSADLNKPYIALGADLSSEQRSTVLSLLEVTEAELADYTVATVTNEMEHQYLDSYLSSSVIGSKSLSSVKVIGKEDGYGVKVTAKNISYCTTGMYQNALVTAGMKNADVTVAAPMNISGTAALVGAMEAYENMTGKVIDTENLDAATNELVVTSEIGEVIGDQEKAEELVGAVKDIIVSEDINDSEEIEETIEETAEKLEVELSEEDRQQIADLMEKIAKLDIDVETLQQQASELYEKFSGLDIDLGISQEEADGFFAQFGDKAKSLWDSVKGIFAGWFS